MCNLHQNNLALELAQKRCSFFWCQELKGQGERKNISKQNVKRDLIIFGDKYIQMISGIVCEFLTKICILERFVKNCYKTFSMQWILRTRKSNMELWFFCAVVFMSNYYICSNLIKSQTWRRGDSLENRLFSLLHQPIYEVPFYELL